MRAAADVNTGIRDTWRYPQALAARYARQACARAAQALRRQRAADRATARPGGYKAAPTPLAAPDLALLEYTAAHGRTKAAADLGFSPAALRERLDAIAGRVRQASLGPVD